MVRPKVRRRIAMCPKKRLFNDNKINTDLKLDIDEFEAIRLRDYYDIKQKEAAVLMGISQSTFNRILLSARKKLAKSLIERKKIVIAGEDFVTNKERYRCDDCNFEWSNPDKKYESCPVCKSDNIEKFTEEKTQIRRGQGLGLGPNFKNHDSCSCPNCGYKEEKIRGEPCRNKSCPECGTGLVGRGRCFID